MGALRKPHKKTRTSESLCVHVCTRLRTSVCWVCLNQLPLPKKTKTIALIQQNLSYHVPDCNGQSDDAVKKAHSHIAHPASRSDTLSLPHTHILTLTYLHLHTHIHTHIHMYMHTISGHIVQGDVEATHMHTHTCTHTYTHTQTHTHTHTHLPPSLSHATPPSLAHTHTQTLTSSLPHIHMYTRKTARPQRTRRRAYHKHTHKHKHITHLLSQTYTSFLPPSLTHTHTLTLPYSFLHTYIRTHNC